jgi:hypothetical protein
MIRTFREPIGKGVSARVLRIGLLTYPGNHNSGKRIQFAPLIFVSFMYSMPASTELVKFGLIEPQSYSYMGNGHCGGGALKSAIVRLLVLLEA